MKPTQMEALIDFRVKNQMKKERVEIELMTIAHITMVYHMILHDQFDWDAEKTNKLIAKASEIFDSVTEKYVTMDDIKKWLIENGIKGLIAT